MEVLQNSKTSVNRIINLIESGKVVILPSNGIYTLNTNIFNNGVIENIYLLKEKEYSNCLGLYVKDKEMATPFIHFSVMSVKERKIINLLIKKFWPGKLSLVVKTKCTNRLFTKNGFICLESPSHPIITQILTEHDKPLITTSANISNKISCSHISHVKNYFNDTKNIVCLEDSANPKYGIENTILKIDGENISILRNGITLKSEIESYLKENNVNISITYGEDTRTITNINKSCVLAKFITGDDMMDLNKYSEEYLSKSILVDFGKRNIEKKDMCAGYVDLSENSDIYEAMYNIYDVQHQLENLPVSNIIFMDFFTENSKFKTLGSYLKKICLDKQILIPIKY